jgi:K+ transporter
MGAGLSAIDSRRSRLLAVLARNAQSATALFHLPAHRVVELGMQVAL